MKIETITAGHAIWRSRRGGRLLLLALGASLLVLVLWLRPTNTPTAPWWTGLGLSIVVLVAAATALACRTVVELTPQRLRLSSARPWGSDERSEPRSAAQAVRVRGEVVTHSTENGTRQNMVYRVELVTAGGGLPPSSPLWRSCNEVRARAFAERSARAALLPFADAVGDEPIVRSVDQLDQRPESRRPLPSGPAPADVLVDGDDAVAPAVELRGLLPASRRNWARIMPLVLLSTAILSIAMCLVATPVSALPLVLTLVVGAESAVLLLVSWVCCCRTRLSVVDGELRCEQSLFGLPLRAVRLRADAVEQVRVQTGQPHAPHLQPGVAVLTDRRVLVLGRSLDPAACGWLGAWIEQQLWPELPVAHT